MKTKQDLLKLLADVATALRGTFDNSNFEGEAKGRITLEDGVKFFVSADEYGNKGKLQFSSSFPQHVAHEDGSKRSTSQRDFSNASHFDGIKVSHDKDADQIARDIARRFLPIYSALYAQCLTWCEAQATYYENKGNLAKVAAEVLEPFGYGKAAKVRACVDYIGGNYVNVRVEDLDADKLRKLAAFLQTL